MVGNSSTGSGRLHAFRRDLRAGMRDLGGSVSAVAISGCGRVAVNSAAATGLQHAFVRHRRSELRDLDRLGAGASAGVALNDRSQVAGVSVTDTGEDRGSVRSDGTGTVEVGDLGG